MSESSTPGGLGDGLSRADMALVRQAARNGWKVSEDVRTRILKRLVSYIDTETEAGMLAEPRIVLAAARTIVTADLSQQKIDLARERFEGLKDELNLTDVVTQAEKRADQFERDRDRERTGDRPSGPVP